MRKALTAALTTAALTTAAALATLAMTLPANAATTPPQSAPHKNASGHAVMRGGKILSTVKSTDSHGDTTYTTTTTAGTIKVEIARPGPGMIPQSASGCVGNNLWNNVQTCFAINGSGYYEAYSRP
ncbi:MAG TPA: hypothetical protein VMV92_26560 [Streptosporangiaceae bacterium]|nr:hypothetical protein [Streptosporangiaceae bacterium]